MYVLSMIILLCLASTRTQRGQESFMVKINWFQNTFLWENVDSVQKCIYPQTVCRLFANIHRIVCLNNPIWYWMFRRESGSLQDNADTFRITQGNVWDNQFQCTILGADVTEMQRLHGPNLFPFNKVPSWRSYKYR